MDLLLLWLAELVRARLYDLQEFTLELAGKQIGDKLVTVL